MRPRIPVTMAVAIVVAAGCATTTPGRVTSKPPTLAETIDAQVAQEEAIAWTPRRPLTWSDFRATPPDEAGATAARTVYRIIDGARCVGSDFEYRVVTTFRPKESWVRLSILQTPADNMQALRHEQTHFDLSEVHARRLRRYFAELLTPCSLTAADLNSAADRIGRDEKAAQEQYDNETENGRNVTAQARWDKEVNAQLLSLAKFVR